MYGLLRTQNNHIVPTLAPCPWYSGSCANRYGQLQTQTSLTGRFVTIAAQRIAAHCSVVPVPRGRRLRRAVCQSLEAAALSGVCPCEGLVDTQRLPSRIAACHVRKDRSLVP